MPILYNSKSPQLVEQVEGTNLRFIEDVRREEEERKRKEKHKEQAEG